MCPVGERRIQLYFFEMQKLFRNPVLFCLPDVVWLLNPNLQSSPGGEHGGTRSRVALEVHETTEEHQKGSLRLLGILTV